MIKIKQNLFNLISSILFLFFLVGIVYAANTFPTDENDWADGEVIESDWANQLEYRIGATGTTSKSTLTYQVNTLMATTSFPSLSIIGTITTGIWNGTSIANTYGGTGLNSSALTGIAQIVAGTWSASSTLSTAYGGTGWNNLQANTVLLGNGAGRMATTSAGTDGYVLALSSGVPTWLATSTLSTITGTLAVTKGGTGQTSFGQGWLNSDGSALSASTSPTVNYLTATSTATSTFAGSLALTEANATSTFAGGLDLSDGCFAIDGTCFSGGSGTVTSIATTFPILGGIITTTGTLTFGGLSTSTAAVIGNIPYFSGVNTFANTGTTSLTATSPLSLSQPISVIGSSASALTISVAGDWTGTIDSNNFAGGAIGVGELIYGGSAGSFSELALGTGGYVLAISGGAPAWVATTTLSTISGTLDISGQSNLTCGTNCTLTGDDISVDDAFLLNTGDIGTGVYDFGGATSVEIPNGSPTVDTTGEIGIDTTSGQLKWSYNGSTVGVATPFYTTGFSYSTSSAWSATTTVSLAPAAANLTFNEIYCKTSGTLNVSLNDGTNRADLMNASSTVGFFNFSTNNTFTKGEEILVDVGTPASSPTRIGCRFKFTYDQD